MPLMAVVTRGGSVGVAWDDMSLQPVFAAPNFFDHTPDHRMALRGKNISATVRIAEPAPLEETISWGAGRRGLPPVPTPPRTERQQHALCRAALEGPLQNEEGWGHCLQERFARRPYADMASTWWRLTGELPDVPEVVYGGAHLPNEAIYFVTGRAQQWLDIRRRQARQILSRQRDDGSFRYDGPLARTHFEDTASGVCARPTATLLEAAKITGDEEFLAAGLRGLAFMRRFRTPRGAQTWEVPLHTPDILASAWLVKAYVLGYELTGEQAYLDDARRWAVSGLPFVYQWDRYPTMRYATIPVFGATHWHHNWIGLPVQWCGLVYADALVDLAAHDGTLDWRHVARGILVSGEQQQYPEGPKAGLLPDAFQLRSQRRVPADINPCALVSLRDRLDGNPTGLSVVVDDGHRVIAPFPVRTQDGKAHVTGRRGCRYQVVVDGRIVEVTSQGEDTVALD